MTSDNMRPGMGIADVANRGAADAQHSGHVTHGSAFAEQTASFQHVGVRQARSGVALALAEGTRATRVAAPQGLIGHVIEVRPDTEMRGIHAGGVIATVSNLKSSWDGAVGQLPGYARGNEDPLSSPPATYAAVPLRNAGTLPLPAIVRPTLLDLRPEPRLQGATRWARSVLHAEILSGASDMFRLAGQGGNGTVDPTLRLTTLQVA